MLIRLENLSKYFFVLSYEKYAPKLQNLCDIRKQNAKKVTKGSKNSHFNGHYDIKKQKSLVFVLISSFQLEKSFFLTGKLVKSC